MGQPIRDEVGDRDRFHRAIAFIQVLEQETKSPFLLANQLRGYTRAGYNSVLWSVVTSLRFQDYQGAALDFSTPLAGQETDFAHAIAALADRIDRHWLLVNVTAPFTSWAGDLGQAILAFRRADKGDDPGAAGRDRDAVDYLGRKAGPADLAANIAAFEVGRIIKEHPKQVAISAALRRYDTQPYATSVRNFLAIELGGDVAGDRLRNGEAVAIAIARGVKFFLACNLSWQARGDEVAIAADYFLEYLLKAGNLTR